MCKWERDSRISGSRKVLCLCFGYKLWLKLCDCSSFTLFMLLCAHSCLGWAERFLYFPSARPEYLHGSLNLRGVKSSEQSEEADHSRYVDILYSGVGVLRKRHWNPLSSRFPSSCSTFTRQQVLRCYNSREICPLLSFSILFFGGDSHAIVLMETERFLDFTLITTGNQMFYLSTFSPHLMWNTWWTCFTPPGVWGERSVSRV